MKSVQHIFSFYLFSIIFNLISIPVFGQNQLSAEQHMMAGENALRQGEPKIAETSFRLAIEEFERLGQTENQILAMMKLRDLLVNQNRLEEAVQYAMMYCDFRAESGTYDLEEKLLDYGQIAYILGKLNSEKDALSCLELVKAVAQQLKTPFAYGYFNNTAGLVYANLDKWDSAVKYYKAAGECFTRSIDPRSAYLNETVPPLLAAAYYNAGNLDESYDAYMRLSGHIRDKLGTNSRKYAEAICWLANIEAYKGMLNPAKSHYIECWGILKHIVPQDLALLPSNSRGEYWKDINDVMWRMVPFALEADYNEDAFTTMAYEALMYSKGLLLSLEKSSKKIVEETGDSSLLTTYMGIANLRNQIAQLQASNQGIKATEIYAEMDSLDRVFNQQLKNAGLRLTTSVVNPNEIISRISKSEALIDFADFVKKDGTHIYAAFVVKPGMKHPKLIKVFEQSRLDSLLVDNNGKYSDLYNDYNQEAMYEIVWEPLITELKVVKTIYFVPSGILNQIAVEAIQIPDGEYMGDKYNIVRLSNSKEVRSYKNNSTLNKFAEARLYGGLKYDVAPDIMVSQASAYELPSLLAVRGGTDSIKAQSGFEELKRSGEEVIEISDLLSHNGITVTKLMATEGTEESFVSMSGNSPDLLLVSTHGFYYSPENVPSWSSLNGYDNPMYLTGLVMSGGNAEYLKREIPEGVMGGLLTSSDIAGLDLSGTQLVVLSACETGLGETTNEGVYGLQRAFKKAGAQTLVLSLWPVSDMATKDFMTMFHLELAKNKWDKRTAFANARQSLRKKYDNPYYWAAFIMID